MGKAVKKMNCVSYSLKVQCTIKLTINEILTLTEFVIFFKAEFERAAKKLTKWNLVNTVTARTGFIHTCFTQG